MKKKRKNNFIKNHPLRFYVGIILIIIGFPFLFHEFNAYLLNYFSFILGYFIKPYWANRFIGIGAFNIVIGSLCLLSIYFSRQLNQVNAAIVIYINNKIRVIKKKIGKIVDIKKSEKFKVNKIEGKKILVIDVAIVFIFLIVALLFYQYPCQGDRQFVELGGDAATYASLAAALDHPEYFKGDPMFDNPNISKVFSLILVQLIRFNAHYTHNYGMGFTLLIIPHIFFQMLGFYLLGRRLFENRIWAFFLSMVTFVPISLGPELWGIWLPLPRFLFQTFLPYLLCLAYIWKEDYKKWPWLMVFSGIIFYIHPFSGLAWGFTVWIAFLFFLPKNWTLLRKLITILELGFLFLLFISPYLANYLRSQPIGMKKDYEFVYYIIKTFFPRNITDALTVLRDFIGLTFRNGILLIALIMMILFLFLFSKNEKEKYKIVYIWIAGIFIISIVLPFLIGLIEKLLRIIPTESSLLTRGYRYLLPLIFLMITTILANVTEKYNNRNVKFLLYAGSILFLLYYGYSQREYFKYPMQKLESWFNSKPVCFTNEVKSRAMESIRELTPVGSKIFIYSWKGIDTTEFYEIRYFSLRPLVFHIRDGGIFAVMDYEKLRDWYNNYWSIIKINEEYPQTCDRLMNLIELEKKLKADYLFIDSNGNDLEECNSGLKTIFKIGNYYLLQ